MKSKDQILLEEAYLKVVSVKQEVIEEKGIKSAVAGAALGVAAMLPTLHAGETKASVEPSASSMVAKTDSKEMRTFASANEAYEKAIELIHLKKPIPSDMLAKIASDKEIAERCANLIVLKGLELPQTLRKVVGDVDKRIKSSLMGP